MKVQHLRGGIVRRTFEEVTRRRLVRGPCVQCGKLCRKTFKVTHTINPFNRNEDGTIRAREEIEACVEAELDRDAANLHCAQCWEDGREARIDAALKALDGGPPQANAKGDGK